MRLPFIKDKITGTTTVGLTEAGKTTAEKYVSRGSTFAVLSKLSEQSPMTISELAIETQIDITEAKQRIKVLHKQGLVRITGNET